MANGSNKGSFTIPGESGFEELTLSLAQRWGADCVRDSEGTKLSEEILASGMQVYSTICIIREHNEYLVQHPQFQQQVFLKGMNALSFGKELDLPLLDGYFKAQFEINDGPDSLRYWQVFDRTSQCEVPRQQWHYDKALQKVVLQDSTPFHEYSVNFLAWRIWEEINMYNHVTNSWKKEPLRQLDPRYPEAQQYLLDWLGKWCEAHPETSIVRLTSLFYNFVWIWGEDPANRNLFSDWASYDFTVSPLALGQFAAEYGYELTSEDFINRGFRNPGHIAWTRKMKDYLDFTNRFVVTFAKKLVDMIHRFNKKAYVFYDDSWVGMEPYGKRFASIGFDGIIKCVFSAFEVRLCAGVSGPSIHELRLHPYLFPVGLGGAPTFSEGGDPALDARRYWVQVRRALLRTPIQRIGLGGYLHLVQPFPDFVQAIEMIAKEFRTIKGLHEQESPLKYRPRLAVLTDWGKLRSWTCGGHLHEHPDLDLTNILESLAGLPFEVTFLSFEELSLEKLKMYDVLLNAGTALSSWSGASAWASDTVVEILTQWVWEGGTLLACNEASAWEGCAEGLRMAPVLGVGLDDGRRLCHGKWPIEVDASYASLVGGASLKGREDLYLLDTKTAVMMAQEGHPCMTRREFGKGKGIYFSEFRYSAENTKMLERLILASCPESESPSFSVDVASVGWTFFEGSGSFVLSNTSETEQKVTCHTPFGVFTEVLEPFGMKIRILP